MERSEVDRIINERSKVYMQIFTEQNAAKFADAFVALIKEYQEQHGGPIHLKGKEIFEHLRKEPLRRYPLGIGAEWLLKAIYLKFGYVINYVKKEYEEQYKGKHPLKLSEVEQEHLQRNKTVGLGYLIDHLENVLPSNGYDFNKDILLGLRLAQLFRNAASLHAIPSSDRVESTDDLHIMTAFRTLWKIFSDGNR